MVRERGPFRARAMRRIQAIVWHCLLKVLPVGQVADMPAYRRHSLDTVGFADLGPVLASGRAHLFVTLASTAARFQ